MFSLRENFLHRNKTFKFDKKQINMGFDKNRHYNNVYPMNVNQIDMLSNILYKNNHISNKCACNMIFLEKEKNRVQNSVLEGKINYIEQTHATILKKLENIESTNKDQINDKEMLNKINKEVKFTSSLIHVLLDINF